MNLSQTWSHYKSVQSKLGNSVQLNEKTDAGKLVNFDIVKQKNTATLIQMDNPVDFWQQTFASLIACLKEQKRI